MIIKSELTKLNISDIILDSIPAVIYIFNKEGQLIAWNKKAMDVYGYSAEEMKNKPLLDFIDKADHENVIRTFQNSFIVGNDQVENTALTKDGRKIPYIGSATAVVVDGEAIMIGIGIDISELHSAREQIKYQMDEIAKLNNLLQAENIYLKDQLVLNDERHKIIGKSEALKYILFKISQVAPTDASVLIEGETGTGKELIARAIHKESNRKDKPFLKVNCASIPENLIESELFGHEKGSFTGAFEKRIGRFEMADGGTIFLDEIGELPLNLQPKLLTVLQQGEFERIGSSKTIKTDVRIISATNKVLQDEIKKGRFRSDLYYRLNVFPISVTPLRDRKEDIPELAEYYLRYYSEIINKPIKAISKEGMQRLINYSWPGNVRELENVIERAVISSRNKILSIESFPESSSTTSEITSLEENEKNYIINALEKTYWKISGEDGAAAILKINPETLRSKIRKLGIKRK